MWQTKEERVQREQAKKDADKKYKVAIHPRALAVRDLRFRGPSWP